MDKTLNEYLNHNRYTFIVCPMNVSTKHVASTVKSLLDSACDLSNNMISSDRTLLIYENEHTLTENLELTYVAAMENPPKRIVIFIGFNTKVRELKTLDMSLRPIPFVYAKFAEKEVDISLDLLPLTELQENIQKHNVDKCDENSCKTEEEVYVDDGLHYNINDAKILHITRMSLSKLYKFIDGRSKKIFLYYDNFTEENFKEIKHSFDDHMKENHELKARSEFQIIIRAETLYII